MVKTERKMNKTTLGSLALKGYDPVAYFTEGKAVQGRKEFTHEYADANWRFVSAANRDLFAHKNQNNIYRNMAATAPGGSAKESSSTATRKFGKSSMGSST